MPASCFARVALILLATVVAGCNNSGPEIAPVHGRVTLNGQPLANADIQFQPDGAKRPSMARTDAQGGYELVYRRGQSGAIVGTHSVRIWVSPEVVRNPPVIAKQFDTESDL